MTGNPIIVFKVPKNDARGSLLANINSVVGTLTVGAGEGANFPTTADGDFWVSIDAEILLCTSRAADVLTVTRAQQSTVAAAHNAGAAVELRITEEALTDINNNIVKGVLQGWADDTNLNPSIGTLPANAFVYRVDIYVLELFDAGVGTMNVGYDAVQTWYVNTYNIAAASVDHVDYGHADAGGAMGIVDATSRAVEIYVNAAASTTGKVYVAVHYIVADAIPA